MAGLMEGGRGREGQRWVTHLCWRTYKSGRGRMLCDVLAKLVVTPSLPPLHWVYALAALKGGPAPTHEQKWKWQPKEHPERLQHHVKSEGSKYPQKGSIRLRSSTKQIPHKLTPDHNP
jgi:hypothetical protein